MIEDEIFAAEGLVDYLSLFAFPKTTGGHV